MSVTRPKFIDLFDGLKKGAIDFEGGYITTSFFDDHYNYVHFETIRFETVKDVYEQEDGCVFQSDGKKMYVLFEPKNYPRKHVDPTFRDDRYRIPFRFDELELFETESLNRLMIGKHAIVAHNSFTVARPSIANFAFYFYIQPGGSFEHIIDFYEEVFRKDLHISRPAARKALEYIEDLLGRFDDFQ